MDDDLERPCLSCHPCSEKLPIVLSSSEDSKAIIQVPASISQYLRDYQRDGVRFLYQKFKDGEGGILADDMGLGKTIQAIAFIAAVLLMKGTKEDKLRHCSDYVRLDSAPGVEVPSLNPVLIICPASLIENWHEELTTWAYFKCFKMTAHNRSDLLTRAKLKQYDVLLVSHDTARLSIDYLNCVDWTCVIVDEVHRIKDSHSQLTMALQSLRCKLRYGLTGTPFQNNLKEVYCLLKWSNPQSVKEFDTNTISRLMEKGFRNSATKRETTDSLRARSRFREVRNKSILRRTKEILAKHLPSKTDQVVFCEPTEIQRNIYQMITKSPFIQNFLHGWNIKAGREQNRLIFQFLTLLQKTANHVGLLASGLSRETNKTSYEICCEALKKFANLENVPQKKWIDALSDNTMSGKMLVLSKLLPQFLEKNDKVLIFSSSLKLLDLIQKHIVKERYTHCRLDGSTPADDRCAMVRAFNTSPDQAIFLVSTKAGGVGLNITGANVVIIFDPSWNPASDLQAQDRAYRLGQQRDVRVYRLLTISTIEEFVYWRQVYKQQRGSGLLTEKNVRRYFDSIQGDPKYNGELFGLKNLFSFCENDRSLTEEILTKQQEQEERLLRKLQGKFGEEIPNAFISECPIAASKSGTLCGKSGLSDLCEEDLGVGDYDKFVDTALNEELLKEDEVTNINTKLKDIVGPSVVEDFVSDCAVRDVLEKRKNSHLPAFDCFIETQETITETAATTSTANRIKFNKIAEKEFLTPYQLALKIMSFTKEEKSTFSQRYAKSQKRHQPVVGDRMSARKRFRVPLSTTDLLVPDGSRNTSNSPVNKTVSSFLSNPSKEDKMSLENKTVSCCLGNVDSEATAPPENKIISSNLPSVNEEAITFVEGLFRSNKPSGQGASFCEECPCCSNSMYFHLQLFR
ncbi:DNA excision repair protein ERCC-6-like 2 isoform X2 [Frankliniella occidentalis]|uniref:DNA repair and recombination protein RAD54-like n=1 Tax=Frankliniella occidentalis TaxID=133901 RepID=A0A9C6WX23_FRAOC|nr:DNA excision repair protein ERCC-6-like 2 isoform X2 [Frankliniella occidentalis]